MARSRTSSVTHRPPQGGQFITAASADNIGPANYTAKTNWRRVEDREVIREGDTPFWPNASLPVGNQPLVTAFPVTGLWELDRPNGERAIVAATRTTLFRFNFQTGDWSIIGSGFAGVSPYWEGESLDGYLILNNTVDLPVSFRVEHSEVTPIHELRETGVSAVGTIAVYNGFLLCADITELQEDQLAAWMNGATPYGVVPTNLTNRIRYKIIWSDYGAPRNWSPIISGTIEASTPDKITLAFPVHAFEVGSKLAVLGAGPSNGTLGGQTNVPDGVPVTDVTGAVLTMSISAAATPFPLSVQVLRFADTSSFVGSSSIQDDSSAILRMVPLKGLLMVYRETSIFSGRYTAVVETPFTFRREYAGGNLPFYPRAICELEGNEHVYATETSFYRFDGSGEPRQMEQLHLSKEPFFSGINSSNTGAVFAQANPITNELMFFCPTGVLAYDIRSRTTSWIDQVYGAAAYVRKPEETSTTTPSEFWLLLATEGAVVRYGLSKRTEPIYTRRGVPYTCTLRFGLTDAGDDLNEKDLIALTPFFSTFSDVADVVVHVYGRDIPSREPTLLFTHTLTELDLEDGIEAFFRNILFNDELVVTSGEAVEFTGRSWRFQGLRTEGVTRIS